MFSCFIRRQKSSLCRKKMKHQPKKELLPVHLQETKRNEGQRHHSPAHSVWVTGVTGELWKMRCRKKTANIKDCLFFSVLWDKPRQQIVVLAPSYASAFFRVTLSILKNKNSFSCSKTRPHSFAHSCVPRVRHCNPLEKHFTNHRQQNVFLLIEKKRRKAWSHSFI